jgi:hypothetical protein
LSTTASSSKCCICITVHCQHDLLTIHEICRSAAMLASATDVVLWMDGVPCQLSFHRVTGTHEHKATQTRCSCEVMHVHMPQEGGTALQTTLTSTPHGSLHSHDIKQRVTHASIMQPGQKQHAESQPRQFSRPFKWSDCAATVTRYQQTPVAESASQQGHLLP